MLRIKELSRAERAGADGGLLHRGEPDIGLDRLYTHSLDALGQAGQRVIEIDLAVGPMIGVGRIGPARVRIGRRLIFRQKALLGRFD